MNKKYLPVVATAGLAVCCAALLLCGPGCDKEDFEPIQDATLTITPQTVYLRTNQSAEFMASGGLRYTWSVSNQTERWALLSAGTGEKIVYTSIKEPKKNNPNHLEVLTCSSTIGGEGTNSGGYTITAEAYIWHTR